ncbi:MAG: glutathione S-transferase family protein [Dongiaceae bacterium]
MQLIGYYESTFVRRVAITLMLYDMAFEHRPVPTSNRAAVEPFSPLGRIPALVLDDGETLIDSTMIVDHLDLLAPPDRALTPRSGPERRAVNRIVAIAMGTGDKYVSAYYESTKRPESHVWGPWLDRLEEQVQNGLRYLDDALAKAPGGRYFVGDRPKRVFQH